MPGFDEKGGSKSEVSYESLKAELSQAEAERAAILAGEKYTNAEGREIDSSKMDDALRNWSLQALNEKIAQLNERLTAAVREGSVIEGAVVEPTEDLNIPAATDFIMRMQAKLDRGEALSSEEEVELGTFTLTVAEAQKEKPDSKNLRIALTLLSDIRTKNEAQRGA